MILFYINTKVKVCSMDRDTESFGIVTGVLRGDANTSYLFIIYLDYMHGTSIDLIKENSSTLEKARSRWYPALTITDADYADDIALLANTCTQAESLLHNLEKEAGDIGLHGNAEKTEYMCFNPNQRGDNCTQSGGSLKPSHLRKMISIRD